MQPRKSLIIYFKSPKVLKRLKTYGNLAYYHKKRKYAVLYVDEENMDDLIKKIEKLHHVRRAEPSLLDDTAYKPEDFTSFGEVSDTEPGPRSEAEDDEAETDQKKE